MLRQLLISLVVVAVAIVAYVALVPGAVETLDRMGITLPAAVAIAPVTATPPARTSGFRGGGNDAPVVVTARVVDAVINDELQAIGEGAAARSVTVMSPASGTLVELLVRPGDVVEAGAVIGRLDAEAEEIAFAQARLALEDAETTLARTDELARANAATTVQLETARLAVDNARLELESAELALQHRTITTPVAGTVGLFQVSPGNAVSAQTVVTTVEDTSHIVVSFWVPERYAPSIRPGMPVTTDPVALPGTTLAGTVSAVDNRIDPASRTLEVLARIPNAGGELRPGMSFSVGMNFPGKTFPAVDPLSIQWSSEGAYLWKYDDGRVERLPVAIIQRNSDGVLVKADLAPGDQVVTQGLQQLRPGNEVRLLEDFLAEVDGQGGGGERS